MSTSEQEDAILTDNLIDHGGVTHEWLCHGWEMIVDIVNMFAFAWKGDNIESLKMISLRKFIHKWDWNVNKDIAEVVPKWP